MSDLFPDPSPADWRGLAEKALKDRPLESLVHLDADGLAIRPLYAAATGGAAVSAPRPSDAEGRAWDVRTLVEGDDPAAVNAAVLDWLGVGLLALAIRPSTDFNRLLPSANWTWISRFSEGFA